MTSAIVRASLRFRLLLVGIAAGLLVLGVTQLRDAPVDVLPEFTPPYAEVQTEAPGLSAQEVEQLITVPLEADLLNGVQGVETIRSESVPGLSSITMVFEPGTDIYRGRQLVQERLTQAHALPNVSAPPTLLPPLSSASRVLMIGLSSDELSGIDRSVIARWTVQPRLMGVPGVANVAIWGMRDQELQVQVDPRRLRDRDVTLNQIVSTTGNAQVVSPLSYLEASTPGTGGFIETPQQRLQVRNVVDKIADPQELGKVAVEGTGGKLRLGDVTDIKVDHQPLIGDAIVGGGEGLMLVVEKFPSANTREVTEGVEDALEDLSPGLSGVNTDASVFRPASYIDDALGNLGIAALIGAGLLVLTLIVFLRQWRAIVVALITIPLSLIAAALTLDALGETFNAITLTGLAIAVAIIVGDAVTGAERVARRMHARREAGDEAPTASIVTEATSEIRSPLVYGTLIALLAIVPLAVMDGRPGAFFEPMALAYALAVVVATVIAVTLTPALLFLLFAKGRPGPVENTVASRVGGSYQRTLSGMLRRPGPALIGAGVCALAALIVLPLLNGSLVPSFKDRDVLVRLDGAPGTSNPRMTQISRDLSTELRAIPDVENVGAHVGRAVSGDQIVDVNSSELWVRLASDADHDRTIGAIEQAVEKVQGVSREVVNYSTETIREVGALRDGENPVKGSGLDVLTGADKPLVVRVYGQDLDVVKREAQKVRDLVADVDGVVDPQVENQTDQPTLRVEVDLDKARRYGIKPGDVRRAEASLLQGIQVGSIFQDQKVFSVIVQGVPEIRRNVQDVRNLLIDRPDGGTVRLGDVADVTVERTPAVIQRDAVSRRVDVEAGVDGRSLGDVKADIENRLQDVRFPLEYHAEVLTPTTSKEIGSATMIGFAIAAVVATFLLLQAAFRSWGLAAVVLASLPAALVGGVLVALIDGADLTLGAFAALVTLFGLAARNGVQVVGGLQDDRRADGELVELVGHGARERFIPIVATAVGLACLAAPFALMGSPAGLEILHPMALVLLGGLVTTTVVALFVLPAAVVRFAGEAPPPVSPEDDLLHRWAGVEPGTAPVAGGPPPTVPTRPSPVGSAEPVRAEQAE
jgi:CzcA family heavy metal efflux pump